ncbi:hypothetical protein NMY22_g19579 [Coprinellus aureogranulatus]|nr:hypothetical protein NMY22_g19579 [Coprinellus aureogranulatus]
MLPRRQNKQLIREAWDDFNRRVRWRLYFSFKGEDEEYDPDYETDRPISGRKVKLPDYIERGLAAGKVFVYDTISKIPDEQPWAPVNSLIPKANEVRDFLIDNDYVVTGTDKNLGIAVSERTWVKEKSLQLLNDVNNYKCIPLLTANGIFNEQNLEMAAIADLVEKRSRIPCQKQLAEFLRSKLTPTQVLESGGVRYTEPHAVPEFYALFKIPLLSISLKVSNPSSRGRQPLSTVLKTWR